MQNHSGADSVTIFKIPDPPTSPSQLSFNGFSGGEAQCFLFDPHPHRLSFLFSSKMVVYGHCLVTLPTQLMKFFAHVPLVIMWVLIIFLYSAIWTLRNLGSNPLSVSAGISMPSVDLTSKQTSPLLSLPCLNLPPRSWTSSWVVFWTGTLRPLDAKCPPAGRLPGRPTFVNNCVQPNVSDVEQRGGGWSPVLPWTNRFTLQRNGRSQKSCMKLSRNICPQRSLKVTAVNSCTHVSDKLLSRAKASPLPTVHPSDQLPDVFSEYFQQSETNPWWPWPPNICVTYSWWCVHWRCLWCLSTSFWRTCSKCNTQICSRNLFTWSYANVSVRWMFRWTPPRCQTQNQLISCLWRCSTEFKTAIVKPLLKKPSLDHNNLKNYRPVSNLSFLSKLWEKKSLCLNSLPKTCSAPPSQPTVQRTALRRHYWK